jgi:MFS transporter, FSR family, fosmidomycin resistance protein
VAGLGPGSRSSAPGVALEQPVGWRPWRVLFVAAALHACNDAFFYLLYPLLPFIAADLGLSYAQVGLVNATFAGSGALLQLPAGLLGERWAAYMLLAWGNGWVAAGLIAMALAGSFPLLLGAALLGGLGGNVQHPLAAALVARAYEGRRRGAAIGTLNFAGDLGKLTAPILVTAVTLAVGWRATLVGLGLFGLAFSAAVGAARRWAEPPEGPAGTLAPAPDTSGPALGDSNRLSGSRAAADATASHAEAGTGVAARLGLPPSYWLLAVVGMLDATTRTAALTFLPFLLQERDVDAAQVGFLFGLVFAGGAAGKLACGWLGDRLGPFAVVAVTEATTALALLCLVWAPLWAGAGLALSLGFGLNGTSSVLYAAVASLVPDGKRGAGYGVFYTVTQVAGSGAALVYGVLADSLGLRWPFVLMAALTLAVVPLAAPLRALRSTSPGGGGGGAPPSGPAAREPSGAAAPNHPRWGP